MGRDLMHQDEIRAVVREAYAAISGESRRVAERLYSADQLSAVPDVAAGHALGVGNHLAAAALRSGETVLDVGAGAGIDSVLAARAVGPTGRVIALDFLPEMIARTSVAARQAGLDTIETLEAEMEAIPLPRDSVDHVISNGTINLSPRSSASSPSARASCARAAR